ncbi:MAG: hypothetical protein IPL78_16480 [Chloroflexi bacterium]|nr:hypothetical protein [Chloroflexota bacterium]
MAKLLGARKQIGRGGCFLLQDAEAEGVGLQTSAAIWLIGLCGYDRPLFYVGR